MDKKLKIAQIAPYWFDVPPKDYGGTERVISYITEELVSRGHEITLFAAPGSQTKAKLISPMPEKLLSSIKFYLDYNYNAINYYVNAYAFQHASEFDVIHSHSFYLSFPFCDFVKTPVVHTLHNQLPRGSEPENEIMRKYKRLNYVSISDEFRSHFDPLNYVATVYHGLPLNLFPFSQRGGQDLFWIGRASKNKGELHAIEAAKKTGKKLRLALSLRPDTQEYFNKFILPALDTNISIIKNVRFEDTPKYYSDAKILMYPIEWREPFGLIFIESMSCGTPVIAYARGSAAEIVRDGETGYLVNPSEKEKSADFAVRKTGIEGLCEAVEKIYSMPDEEYRQMRRNCRTHVEKNFTVEKMVDKYEEVYYKILNSFKI